ncbi:MAG TPA: ABC transporter ATP-binding protein [Gemmatimonadales bacterium]|nr:ABC transporter ATP-binding protein [Gemmatimonadales bacterium]
MERVSFTVTRGEFLCIVGPTGCGKSTILNLAAGLLRPTSGRVLSFNAPLLRINRHAAYLFQQDVLLPWKTVLENVMLGPLLHRWPRRRAADEARRWLTRVGLGGFESRYPHQLSGGMRKRVALAQNLIVGPSILLMDEPFSALDVHTRELMENDLLALWQEERKTIVFVTHDLEEAIALSDRVLVLAAGPGARVIGGGGSIRSSSAARRTSPRGWRSGSPPGRSTGISGRPRWKLCWPSSSARRLGWLSASCSPATGRWRESSTRS